MITHVVFFKMKSEALGKTGNENAQELAEKFQKISEKIPGVISTETGHNYNREERFYDMCLNQKFESKEALEKYLVHPLHLKVREFVFQVIDHRIVVDYEFH
ncbi:MULTISPECIES: Dabb family protein [Acutalibacteraceae]|uniref:Dabb family protein n=1 Tax=Acutalibacteraceae TaxID=3082771 RepID=UPI001FA988A4|nr:MULTISPECIES: Dabb family protein [Acutalibacteraceae]